MSPSFRDITHRTNSRRGTISIYICIHHRVEDYVRWKEDFDNHVSARQAGGAAGKAMVMRNVDDPNEVTVVLGWSDLKKARTFALSVSLSEAMLKAGVIGSPEVRILES
jgi:hypothetical protein